MTTTPDAHRRYLSRAFELNPCWRSGDLIDLRSRALKLNRLDQQAATGADEKLAKLRRATKQRISRVQAEFWRLPLPELQQELAALDVRQLPELAAVARRLRTAAECRSEFPKLSQQPWMDRELFLAFKNAVALPAAEAGHARERFLVRLQSKRQLKRVKLAARKMQTEYPTLYALESDWLSTVDKYQWQRTPTENTHQSGSSGGGISLGSFEFSWPVWLVVLIVLRLLARLMSASH